MKLLFDYLGLCFFINNPADLAPPKVFMWQTVAFYLIFGGIVEGQITGPVEGAVEVLLRTVMAFSTIAAILLIAKEFHYYKQLFTAIFVCENFIILLASGTEGLYFALVMKHHDLAEEISIALGVLLVCWYIAIISYIFRQLLSFKMGSSVFMAFCYFILTYGVPMLYMDL